MANNKSKIKFFILIIFLFLNMAFVKAEINIPASKMGDFEEIYEQLQEAPFDYIF